jgi:hypothetical protein
MRVRAAAVRVVEGLTEILYVSQHVALRILWHHLVTEMLTKAPEDNGCPTSPNLLDRKATNLHDANTLSDLLVKVS